MDTHIPAPFCRTVYPLMGPIEDVVERLEHALQDRGFVILNKICLHSALRDSFDPNLNPCMIVTTCHPQLAAEALRAERNSVVLLPMNIAVRQESCTNVSVIFEAPEALTTLISEPEFKEISAALTEHMRGLIAALYSQSCKEASRCHSLATSRAHSHAASRTNSGEASTAMSRCHSREGHLDGNEAHVANTSTAGH